MNRRVGDSESRGAGEAGFRARLVDAVYRGLLDPAEVSAVHGSLRVFEQHLLREIEGLDFDAAEARMRGYADLQVHCERAGDLLDRIGGERRTLHDLLSAQPCAALAVQASGRVVRTNPAAQALPELRDLSGVFDLRYDREIEGKLAVFLREGPARGGPLIANGWSRGSDVAFLLVFERLAASFADFDDARDARGPVILVKTTVAAFDAQVWETIDAAYGLTGAEADVVKLLAEGCSLEEAARRRGRSLHTLKSQAKSVFAKTATGGQVELVRLVTTLAHLVSSAEPLASPKLGPGEATRHPEIALLGGRALSYVESGRPDGRPVLFLQPTARPDFTPEVREAFARAGLRVVSPVRPGSWGMARAAKGWGPRDAAHDYLALAEALGLGDGVLVGYRAGAPYALHLAALRPGCFRKVALVDTGAPLDRLSKIEQMPAFPRLLFTGARLAPQFPRLMYRFGGVNLRRRQDDEDHWVRVYFQGNPDDDELLKEARYRRIGAGTIRYTMEDSDQLVRDLTAWSQDWTPLADAVLSATPLHFVHGGASRWFPAEDVAEFCRARSRATFVVVPGAANFLLYAHPGIIARQIAACFGPEREEVVAEDRETR